MNSICKIMEDIFALPSAAPERTNKTSMAKSKLDFELKHITRAIMSIEPIGQVDEIASQYICQGFSQKDAMISFLVRLNIRFVYHFLGLWHNQKKWFHHKQMEFDIISLKLIRIQNLLLL